MEELRDVVGKRQWDLRHEVGVVGVDGGVVGNRLEIRRRSLLFSVRDYSKTMLENAKY